MIFEILMLVCFGAAWPVSVWKAYTTKRYEGKSLLFLAIVLIGYAAGVLHKWFYAYDAVIWLYVVNALMVVADIMAYQRNVRLAKAAWPGAA